MRDSRRKEIAAYITRRGSVTMPELCETFHVSMNTIRADVSFLEQTGTVEKVYGGVRAVGMGRVRSLVMMATVWPG